MFHLQAIQRSTTSFFDFARKNNNRPRSIFVYHLPMHKVDEAHSDQTRMDRTETDPCVAINGDRIEYREFSCDHPQLEPFYFKWVQCNSRRNMSVMANRFELYHVIAPTIRPQLTFQKHSNNFLLISIYPFSFEKKYDPIPVLRWMAEHPMIPVAAVAIYGFLIVWGQHVMKRRPAWNWRKAMAIWNLSLSVFSWIGMFRTAPQLASNLYHMSVRDILCEDPSSTYGSGSSGLWVQLFVLSKFPYVQRNNKQTHDAKMASNPSSAVNCSTHSLLWSTRSP